MAYSLPYEVYVLLEEAFNHDRAKAEAFAHAVEGALQAIEQQAERSITGKKDEARAEVYNALRDELATKEFVRAEINELRAEFKAEMGELRTEIKQQGLLLKVLIGIAVFGLSLFNPAFVRLVEVLAK